MKKIFLSIIIILTLLLNGCAYRDMNRLQFSTMAIIDKNEAGEIILYQEFFSADRGDGRDLGIAKRVIMEGKGDTIGDAFYKSLASSSLPAAYDVNKVIAFTEKSAKQGLEDYIGAFDRNQKPTLKEYLFICEGDPVEVLHTKLTDEAHIGVYLDEVMVFQSKQSRIIPCLLNDYFNNRLMGCTVGIMPIFKKVNNPTAERIEISGAAVLVEDKMVEKLSSEEVAAYKQLKNDLKIGDATIKNPQQNDKLVSLIVLSNKTKNKIETNGEEVILNTEINTLYSIESVQGKFDILDDKVKEKVIKLAEEDIKKRCTELFQKYKEKGIDLLNVEMQLKRKYPDAKITDVIKHTRLNLNVTVKLDGSQNNTNSR